MQNNQLIIFSKTPVKGKVKTRLAKQLGLEKALEIHNRLFKHTFSVAKNAGIPFTIYLNEIPEDPVSFDFKIQQGDDLGDKMCNALKVELLKNENVCIIGSDCLELTPEDINLAFEKLAEYDVVIGPANDGGYYLIGMKTAFTDLFTEIIWGASTVLEHTIDKCGKHTLTYFLLQQHNDIDRPEDVPTQWL